MRFGIQMLTKQALMTGITVSACFAMASTHKISSKKALSHKASAQKLTSGSVVEDQSKVANTVAPQTRAKAISTKKNLTQKASASGTTLRRQLRKAVVDQQPTMTETLTTPSSDYLPLASTKTEARFFSGNFTMGRSTSLYDFQDGTRKDSFDTLLRLNLNMWPYDYTVRISGGYSQDIHNSENNDFGDTSISLRRKPYSLGETFNLLPSLTGIVPTSKASSTLDNLTGAVRAGLSLGYTSLRIPGLTAGAALSGGQNFNQYDTNMSGKVLTKYVLNQSVSAGYAYGRFGVSAEFVHKNGWTYQGALKESFEHTEELGAEISKMISVAIGHTNGGSALKPNGLDSNIEVISETNSMVYASLTLIF